MAQTNIQTASSGQQRWVKILGPATMRISPLFMECLNLLSDDQAEYINVVLSDCDWLDSTFAGCLIGFSRGRDAPPRPQLTLKSPSERCLNALKQMNLHTFLTIENQPAPTALEWQEFTSGESSADKLADIIVNAHEDLADADPQNAKFKQIARAFREDLERRRQQES